MPTSTHEHAVVIGGGIGGLSTALSLAARGWEVTVVDKEQEVGGKMREVEVAGRGIDIGPTVLTMRWIFDELLDDLGESLDDELDLTPADCLARHAWQDGSTLDLFVDQEKSVEAVREFAGDREARGFVEYAKYAREIYDAVEEPFLKSTEPSLRAITKQMLKGGLGAVRRIDPMRTMWSAIQSHFDDPRLVQLFGRYSTYVGSAPRSAPATLNLISFVETQGVWMVGGGMVNLARALRRVLERHGGTVRCGERVAQITVERGRATGVELASGERIAADAVVCNADVAALAEGHLGRRARKAVGRVKPETRSLSALTWASVARPSGFDLEHHNVFFSTDYRREFEELFERRRVPAQPTVYVCAQDRGTRRAQPDGDEEALFILVNAPPTGDTHTLSSKEIDTCQTQMLQVLRRCGLEMTLPANATRVTTPTDFERLCPGTGGAIYGQATHGMTSSLRRQGVRSSIPDLYLAGGSVHPGAGVPMVALSGRLSAQAISEDRRSTGSFLAAAIRGGT